MIEPPPAAGPEFAELCLRCQVPGQGCGSRLLELRRYWQSRRRGRPFPARSDIDPLDLTVMLPNIFLVDIEPGPRFRYRLSGTGVDDIHGQTLTGKTPGDIKTPEVAQIVQEQYEATLRSGAPRCDHLVLHGDDGSYWHYERLILPLAADGRRIDMFLCGIYRL